MTGKKSPWGGQEYQVPFTLSGRGRGEAQRIRTKTEAYIKPVLLEAMDKGGEIDIDEIMNKFRLSRLQAEGVIQEMIQQGLVNRP